jgi:hypothetical protein
MRTVITVQRYTRARVTIRTVRFERGATLLVARVRRAPRRLPSLLLLGILYQRRRALTRPDTSGTRLVGCHRTTSLWVRTLLMQHLQLHSIEGRIKIVD